MTSFPVHTVEDIITTFGLKEGKITPIDGDPTLQTLLKAHDELRNASMKIRHCAKGNFGYLYLVELPAVYATWSNIPYIPPTDPGDTPNIANLFGNAMEQAKLNWQHEKQVFDMHKNVNTALISVFRQAFDAEIISDMETDPLIHTVTDFLTYFDQFMKAYGHIDPLAVETMRNKMEEQWDPTTHDITKLIRQMRDGMRYGQYIGQPISERQLLNSAELNIVRTNHFANEYSQWKSLPPADQTWQNFIIWWRGKYTTWKTLHMAAGKFGYGGAAVDNNENEIDQINAATNAANAVTFQQLTQSNNALTQQLQALQLSNTQLQQQMANAQAMQFQHQPPQQQFVPPPPPHYQQPYQFMAPQVQQQPQQQPYVQPNGGYSGRGYGGRGGGRGYGRGGGRGGGRGYGRGGGRGYGRTYNNQGYNQGYYQGNQGQQQQADQAGGFYQNVNTNMNPVKRHNNMWYCWTHGYDVDHHSGNCMDPKHGHQYNATRTNTMGGCQAKKHKTVLPGNNGQGYM